MRKIIKSNILRVICYTNLILLLFISGCAVTKIDQIPPAGSEHYLSSIRQRSEKASKSITDLSNIDSISESDLDIATASLAVCKKIDNSVDIRPNIDYIDRLSAELACVLAGKTNYKSKCEAICDFIWRKGFVCPNPFWKNFKPDAFYRLWYIDCSSFIDLLKNKRGNCLTLTLLYLSLAERVGLPLYACAVPGHLFIRYDDGENKLNIETTDNGFFYSDDDYLTGYDNSFKKKLKLSYFLSKLSKKQVLGCLMLNMGTRFFLENKISQALFFYETAQKLNSEDPQITHSMAEVYAFNGNYSKALSLYEKELIQNTPSLTEVYFKIGAIHCLSNNMVAANKLFNMSVVVNPQNLDGLFYQSMSFFYLKKYEEALHGFSAVIEADDRNAKAWFYKACVLSVTSDTNNALKCLSKAIKLDRSNKKLAEKDPFLSNLKTNPKFSELVN